jgi:hypothetical protein
LLIPLSKRNRESAHEQRWRTAAAPDTDAGPGVRGGVGQCHPYAAAPAPSGAAVGVGGPQLMPPLTLFISGPSG